MIPGPPFCVAAPFSPLGHPLQGVPEQVNGRLARRLGARCGSHSGQQLVEVVHNFGLRRFPPRCERWCARLMSEIVTTRQLRMRGFDSADLQRLTRGGDLERVRRGAYGLPEPEGEVEDRHRRLINATVPLLKQDGVFSYGSAAVVHGLPVWKTP
jgi:hypothetical protein